MQVAVLGNRSYLAGVAGEKCFGGSWKYPNHHIRRLKGASELSNKDDIALCLGYYRLIKPEYFSRPKHGTFVFHASDLPTGRGWAPVNWALIRGEDKIHITSIKVDEGCDTGPYHMKSFCNIDITDTIKSAYNKVEEEIINHICSILTQVDCLGHCITTPQTGEPTWNTKRTPKDAELDINQSIKDAWLLIRACHNDDYPAFFKLNGKRIYLRYEVVAEGGE